MDIEFDKEIDAILRKTRGDDAAAAAGAHLDADEIAAFADGALPDAARMRYTAHLADCARCRKILSNVFVFNPEAETASAVVSVASTEDVVPWYRKLFAFPQAAYAMGALVLLFSGFFGYLILQNLSGSGSEVSYSANTATNRAAPASERPAAMTNSNATSTTANSTTTTSAANVPFQNANATSAANTARLSTTNTTTAATPLPSTLAKPEDSSVAEVQPMATPAPKPQVRDDADNNVAQVAPASPTVNPNASGATVQKNEKDKEDSYSADGASPQSNAPDSKAKTSRSVPNALKKRSESGAGATRSVGGKTFNNVGGIWFDSAVGNRSPKTVRRGTSEYQKLDAGLRAIADQLGGTVVILWGGKAYRIQ